MTSTVLLKHRCKVYQIQTVTKDKSQERLSGGDNAWGESQKINSLQ